MVTYLFPKGLLMVVSKRWFEFSGGTKFRYILFNLNLTSFLPQFYLFLPLFYLFFNLCFVTNLEPRFGNHGLQTLGVPPIAMTTSIAMATVARIVCMQCKQWSLQGPRSYYVSWSAHCKRGHVKNNEICRKVSKTICQFSTPFASFRAVHNKKRLNLSKS